MVYKDVSTAHLDSPIVGNKSCSVRVQITLIIHQYSREQFVLVIFLSLTWFGHAAVKSQQYREYIAEYPRERQFTISDAGTPLLSAPSSCRRLEVLEGTPGPMRSYGQPNELRRHN